jgi:hypothetical protein
LTRAITIGVRANGEYQLSPTKRQGFQRVGNDYDPNATRRLSGIPDYMYEGGSQCIKHAPG